MSEYKRIQDKIPEILLPLMELHFESVDKVISPGLSVVKWTSLNLQSFIETVNSSLAQLELVIDRMVGIHENRILLLLRDIQNISLVQIPESGTIEASEFFSVASELCSAAAVTIETKSKVIEKAVDELLAILMSEDENLEDLQGTEKENEPGTQTMKRKLEQKNRLALEAENLKLTYEQMLGETQYKLLRFTLECIRRRLAVKLLSYGDMATEKADNPLFEASLVLAVPSIIMKPSLDEIQQMLNRTVSAIISITKGVLRWGQQNKEGLVPVPPTGPRPLHSRSELRSQTFLDAPRPLHSRSEVRSQIMDAPGRSTSRLEHLKSTSRREMSIDRSISLKNFYRSVSEHKEIQKLVSILSSAINSTKQLTNSATSNFSKYSHLWEVEREVNMEEFVNESKPGVNEFRCEMSDYAQLSEVIADEPEVLAAGPIALSSERLKLALTTEARAWVVSYGRAMNHKYQLVMEEVFKSIDDWTKRLSRPLNDLDDIRSIMATLKEIRENEIEIDMSLDPIEVSTNGWSFS